MFAATLTENSVSITPSLKTSQGDAVQKRENSGVGGDAKKADAKPIAAKKAPSAAKAENASQELNKFLSSLTGVTSSVQQQPGIFNPYKKRLFPE
jgi:hypothetical protein